MREELAKLRVEINEEKSRLANLAKGDSFGFLGFEFRRILSRKGAWRPNYTPKLKKRTALLGKLRDVFRRYASQPVGRVIERINPILRGWVNYFAVGHSSRCFSFVKDWVEKKIRRHLMRARKRKGFGWKRWSRQWLYSELGLFNAYRVRRPEPESPTSRIGPISLGMKQAGKPSAGKPHAGFDVAGAGNRLTVRLVRHSQRKRGVTDRPSLRSMWRQSSTLPMRGRRKRTIPHRACVLLYLASNLGRIPHHDVTFLFRLRVLRRDAND